jgi:hypothetical protein
MKATHRVFIEATQALLPADFFLRLVDAFDDCAIVLLADRLRSF